MYMVMMPRCPQPPQEPSVKGGPGEYLKQGVDVIGRQNILVHHAHTPLHSMGAASSELSTAPYPSSLCTRRTQELKDTYEGIEKDPPSVGFGSLSNERTDSSTRDLSNKRLKCVY